MNQPTTRPTESDILVDLAKVPNPILRAAMPVFGPLLKRLLYVDAINAGHRELVATGTPETFFSRTLEILGCKYEVSASDLERIPQDGPLVVMSNHPLGGLDGIIMGDLLRRRRPDVKLMANFLLKKIQFADQHMIFVDPFAAAKPSVKNLAPLRECLKHLKSGGLLGVFPGNKVSHYQWHRGEVADPEWVPHIGALMRRTGASVLPIFIEGSNSRLFNLAGMIHPILRTFLLPREFMRRAHSIEPIRIHIGSVISSTRLKRFESDEAMIRFLRVTTYFIGNRPKPAQTGSAAANQAKSLKCEPVAIPLASEKLEMDIASLPSSSSLIKKGDFEVFIASQDQIPHIIQEIGRGREISFRDAGGGTLKALDLAPEDSYYEHLFIWHRTDRKIVGAYRIGRTDRILAERGPEGLICNALFHFKPGFIEKLTPGLELGRSYVLPEYQKGYGPMLLLMGGIFALVAREPKYNFTFGSVGIGQGDEYSVASRTLIIDLLRSLHNDRKFAVGIESRSPFEGVRLNGITPDEISELVQGIEDVSTLVTGLEPDGKGVPVLLRHYLKLNAKLLDFGVWKNHGNSVVGFLIVDLTLANPKLLSRYMGEEGYANFLAYHGVKPPLNAD
jgi:putative hemolysin